MRSSVIRLVKRAFQQHGISMPDEAREVVFPHGVPVTMLDGKARETPDVGPVKRFPAQSLRAECAELDAASTNAEAGLYSEAGVTVQQDAGFGIRQIADIAMKALSPGINDSTTAVMCVDYLAAILTRLAAREIASPYRLDEGELRLIARGPSFQSLLTEAFDQIRQHAEGNVAILTRQLESLETIAGQTTSANRRRALREQSQWIGELAERTIESPHDRARFENRLARAHEALETKPV